MAAQNILTAKDLLELTTEVVAAYVRRNATSPTDLKTMIGTVYAALSGLGATSADAEPLQQPAVPVKKSISNDVLICLECGERFRSLKRHLATSHDLTPDTYRAKWSLGTDYPMVAPAYSSIRSEMAKSMGLGLGRRPAVPTASAKRAKK